MFNIIGPHFFAKFSNNKSYSVIHKTWHFVSQIRLTRGIRIQSKKSNPHFLQVKIFNWGKIRSSKRTKVKSSILQRNNSIFLKKLILGLGFLTVKFNMAFSNCKYKFIDTNSNKEKKSPFYVNFSIPAVIISYKMVIWKQKVRLHQFFKWSTNLFEKAYSFSKALFFLFSLNRVFQLFPSPNFNFLRRSENLKNLFASYLPLLTNRNRSKKAVLLKKILVYCTYAGFKNIFLGLLDYFEVTTEISF